MATQHSTFNYLDNDKESAHPLGLKSNPLLIRRPWGKVKPTSYNLPSSDFTYGCPNPIDPEGAGELTSKWTAHKSTIGRNQAKKTEMYDYETYLKHRSIHGTQRVDPTETIRFGRPSPASVSVGLLTTYHFQREYLEERKQAEQQAKVKKQRSARTLSAPRATLASTGHTHVFEPEQKEEWKMKQFRNVESRINQIPVRYAALPSNDRPTFSSDAGRFPVVRAGMPEGLGYYQYPESPSALPLQPTKQIQGISAAPSQQQQFSASLPSGVLDSTQIPQAQS